MRPADGTLKGGDLDDLMLGARAMVYGLACMAVDRQLPQWGVGAGEAEARLLGAMDQHLARLKTKPID